MIGVWQYVWVCECGAITHCPSPDRVSPLNDPPSLCTSCGEVGTLVCKIGFEAIVDAVSGRREWRFKEVSAP